MVRLLFAKLVLVAMLLSASTSALAANLVTATRVWPAEDYTRMTFEGSGAFKYQTLSLKKPERLVLDIEDISLNEVLNALLTQILADDPYIQQVRIGQYQPNVVRVVVDLKKEVNFNVFSLSPVGEYKHRLVLDILPLKDPVMAMLDKLDKNLKTQPIAEEQPSLTENPTQKEIEKETPAANKKQDDRIITIAIDAGHGGEDPGAGGASGSREKDITLAIAKKLKTYVDAEPNMRGVLTRDGDYFVSLGGRVVKARKLRADLFISIHADSFTKSSARGSSVFALSERGATSATARYLAQKENQSDLIGGVSLKDKDPILAKTLLDLSQAATINDSLKLGKAVLDYVEEINVLHKKHVEQAGFAVLKSPDIPSILVETAFISNPEEERKLNDNNHQHQLAKSILAGIKKYFAANPALARTVADND
ncbi:MAG: N-acetylmuramoyl-L-alanine amidase [Methylophilaceae bacterium]|jgi:N-acetylmuramoyl-L-alanine amidase|nr:N-acetylmuramoyl-L-alanine amidase [Methylophilaceae bacterium]MDG1453685.1 N-acetylmuramoyl-L-alanine amidase [Methylophilaceae bacterium]